MKSLSSVGLGLSIVFGCLLLALVAEVYYLLWWKKRIINREIENDYGNGNGNPMKELFYMFCWKRPTSSSMRQNGFTPPELCSSMRIIDTFDPEAQSHSQANKEFVFKPFGEDGMHPRFLFTIVEESKEDLESEDGNGNVKGKSLGDLLVVETPYLTPNASPQFFTPPFTPTTMISPYNQHGFNPLFESSTDAEFNRMKSSPPPKFKFLQEAEEKLRRRLQDDDNNKGNGNEVVDGSFITIVVDKKTEREVNHQYHSSTSQVLPLAS